MPSLANYMIATSIKNYVIEHRNRLEKKYIVPLTFEQVFILVFIVSCLAGFSVRIFYNGLYGSILNSFQLRWYGMGWGKAPWYIAVGLELVSGFLGGWFGHYVMNTQFRHNNQPTVTLYQTYTLLYNTIKYQFLRMLCGRANALHWD
tara:strand:+ start:2792 stop:3232 length:441 start_codon:yes stop_codon:yes gene_type:complete